MQKKKDIADLHKSKPIKWNWKTMEWENLTVTEVKLLEKLYPDVDVVTELKEEMPRWLDKKKNTKLAHKKDWLGTIHNWLKKEQIKTKPRADVDGFTREE